MRRPAAYIHPVTPWENEQLEPENGGLVQMIFRIPIWWFGEAFQPFIFQGVWVEFPESAWFCWCKISMSSALCQIGLSVRTELEEAWNNCSGTFHKILKINQKSGVILRTVLGHINCNWLNKITKRSQHLFKIWALYSSLFRKFCLYSTKIPFNLSMLHSYILRPVWRPSTQWHVDMNS